VFGLAWFHTILIERKKFKSLGWNVAYAFNESDYSVCEDLIALYMGRQDADGKSVDPAYDKRAPVPWAAIQYLVARANYGGRVTDERDRRLIQVYAKEIFNEALVAPERWRPYGTDDLTYVYPADEAAGEHPDPSQLFTPAYFYEEIASKMDDADPPSAYGQHINAEIASQKLDSQELLDSVVLLTPQKSGGAAAGADVAAELARVADLIERLPEPLDVRAVKHKLKGDDNPLSVVLLQEV
jgi:dynein heavy chain